MSGRVIATAAGLAAATVAFAAASAGAATFIPGQSCTGDPIAPTQVIEGSFPSSLQGSYVLVPLTVLKGAHGIPGSPDWPKMEPVFNDAITSALLGKASVKDALAAAEKKVNDILAGY